MVTRSLIASIYAWVAISTAQAELSLTPSNDSYELEGMRFTQLAFRDDSGTRVLYSPPKDWEYSGSAAKFILHPKKVTQAEASITTFKISPSAVLDEASVAALIKEITASVPSESTEVAIVSQEADPVIIGQKHTVKIVVGYTAFGEHFQRSVLIVNRPQEQVRFQLLCRKSDFEALDRAFLASLFSIQNL